MTEKAEIKIVVASTAGIGKSTVAMIVQAALEQCGIEASLFDIEEHPEKFTDPAEVLDRIDAISKKAKVRIEVAQLTRSSITSQ